MEGTEYSDARVEHPVEEGWAALFAWDTLLMFSAAIGIVAFSAFRALAVDQLFKKNQELEDLSLKGKTAMMIPIVGSVVLMLFFFFFDFFAIISTLSACLTGSVGFIFAMTPVITQLFPNAATKEVKLPLFGNVFLSNLILSPCAIAVIIAWLYSGHWTLNNVLGMSMVVVSVSFIRLPSIRVATIALVGLFIYDIFWVFYSARIFGENVMVAVATKEASNPVKTLAKTLKLPEPPVVSMLQLPMKLIWGTHILGLGDMVMPGLLVAFAMRYGVAKSGNTNNEYFLTAMIGYSAGLFAAMVMAFVYHHAQPALLYLVPSTLLPIIFLAWKRGELSDIWTGKALESREETLVRYHE